MIGSQIVAWTQITKFLSALIIHCQLGMPLRRQPQNFPWAFSRMPFNANSRNRETSTTDLPIPLYKKEEKKKNWKVNANSHLHFLKSKINMKYLTPWLSLGCCILTRGCFKGTVKNCMERKLSVSGFFNKEDTYSTGF